MNTNLNKLKMLTPSSSWREGFPVGNGCIGAMPYGRIENERVLLNHERLWFMGTNDDLPDVSSELSKLRQHLNDGLIEKADNLYAKSLAEKAYKGNCAAYHPAGDLCISMPVTSPFKNYTRWLDLSSALTGCSWEDNGVTYTRECFVSRVDDTCYFCIKSSTKGAIQATLSLEPHDLKDAWRAGSRFKPPIEFKQKTIENKMILQGEYIGEENSFNEDEKNYGLIARVSCDGELLIESSSIVVSNATEVCIAIKFYVYEEPSSSIEKLSSNLDKMDMNFQNHFEDNHKVHRELYERTIFELDIDSDNTPNEHLLLNSYKGEAPLELINKMANYGRYLLICSSRPGGLPSNLQGIWNGDYSPPWKCFFMLNENLQMNYWQSLPGQIPEALMGVFDFYSKYLDDFKINAKNLYGCNGVYIPSLMTPKTGLITHTGAWIIYWTGAAGWLCHHFYDYYLYSGNEEFFKKQALPFMLATAEFYEDFLILDENEKYVVTPSISPENNPVINKKISPYHVSCNATMDIAIIRELLGNLLNHSNEFEIVSDRLEKWNHILEHLPEYETNSDDAIREWQHRDYEDNYHHRHQSHIYPVFPGIEIDPYDGGEKYNVFKKAVDKRLVVGLGEQTGWSLSHMANINARLGDGETSLECLDILSRSCLGQNFFTYHNDHREMGITNSKLKFGISAPFQIDANMGWTAAIYEMLVYSKPEKIKLFPALPTRFKKGKIDSLQTRCRIDVSLEWDQTKGIYTVKAYAKTDCEVSIIFPDKKITQSFVKGEEKLFQGYFE